MSLSSETTSCMSLVSLDAGTYQEALESVLAWLLEAEDTLPAADDIADTVAKVKEQFHQHEVRKDGEREREREREREEGRKGGRERLENK